VSFKLYQDAESVVRDLRAKLRQFYEVLLGGASEVKDALRQLNQSETEWQLLFAQEPESEPGSAKPRVESGDEEKSSTLENGKAGSTVPAVKTGAVAARSGSAAAAPAAVSSSMPLPIHIPSLSRSNLLSSADHDRDRDSGPAAASTSTNPRRPLGLGFVKSKAEQLHADIMKGMEVEFRKIVGQDVLKSQLRTFYKEHRFNQALIQLREKTEVKVEPVAVKQHMIFQGPPGES
jgi:hypothetical protein